MMNYNLFNESFNLSEDMTNITNNNPNQQPKLQKLHSIELIVNLGENDNN